MLGVKRYKKIKEKDKRYCHTFDNYIIDMTVSFCVVQI